MLIAKPQMAVCCQNLPLGALSNHSMPSVLVGALFKKFGLFLTHLVFFKLFKLCDALLLYFYSHAINTFFGNIRSTNLRLKVRSLMCIIMMPK